MDRAAIVGDAVEYIQELQKEFKQLNNELREMGEEDCQKNKAELKILKPIRTNGGTTCFAPTEQKPESSSLGEKKQTEVCSASITFSCHFQCLCSVYYCNMPQHLWHKPFLRCKWK